MFRRAFWFTAGAAAGVWATTRVNRTLRALAPDSLAAQAADRAVGAGRRLRHFALDVRAGAAQRERELTDALGLTTAPPPSPPSLAPPHMSPYGTGPAAGRQDRTTGSTGPTGKEDH